MPGRERECVVERRLDINEPAHANERVFIPVFIPRVQTRTRTTSQRPGRSRDETDARILKVRVTELTAVFHGDRRRGPHGPRGSRVRGSLHERRQVPSRVPFRVNRRGGRDIRSKHRRAPRGGVRGDHSLAPGHRVRGPQLALVVQPPRRTHRDVHGLGR